MLNPANSPPSIGAEEMFAVAAALPPAEREAYLDAACGDHLELRARIAHLFAAHRAGESPNRPPGTEAVEIEKELARLLPEEAGSQIGHYKLLERIGEGGFGVVWVAEQDRPVRRRVALKIIKMGMNTKEVIARFEQERQALAMMDHPNIAKVLDAGATQYGRPFFVMELVRGVKMTEYCDQAKLTTRERLLLFIAVCHAVQHAHQKGIIHRDLKPANILVTLLDGVPVPKVIDFGVAKATQQQRLTDLTVYTQFEQMLGTPLYMSPEQAAMSSLDIDTRSDIYSLGVVLYELLTGRTPFDAHELNKRGLDEIRRVIREVEPARPSTALSTMVADARTKVARDQQAEPAALIGMLRGDLDWIVMKALEKDRSRRYETANLLATDIERHLADRPVQARPPTRRYRLQRFVKRHKLGVFSGISIAAALIIGTSVSVWQAVRANAALSELRNTAPAFAAQARQLVMEERFDEAVTKLGYAIQLRPESTEYLSERAALLQGQVRLAEAAADFRRILKLQPGDEHARANADLCARLQAGAREAGGGFPHAALAELYDAMTAERRPAAELMPLARVLGRENQIIREYWLGRLSSLPNASNIPIPARLTVAQRGMLDLNLAGTKISDVSPLLGMPLTSLDLSDCSELRSIEALRGMPLHQLNLTRTGVTSLEPLSEVRALEDLIVTGIPATDLSPLSGLPLRKLALASTKVSDLSALRGMPLTHLEVGHTHVTDFSPLEGMPLKLLECSYTPVEDYQPLAKLPLENLAVQGARVGDLGFARDLPLKRLVLAGSRDVSNIKVLNEVKTLEFLVLPGNPLDLAYPEIEGVESLKNHPTLKRITCTLAEGSDADSTEGAEIFWRKWDSTMRWWRPLRAAGIKVTTTRYPDDTWGVTAHSQPLDTLAMFTGSTVSMLDVSGCSSLSDLSPLHDLPLRMLAIAHTAVTDLSPLRGMALRNLWMADTKISDLSPLRGVPLKQLYMDKCSLISDLAPLLDIASLEELLLPENAMNVDILRALPKLRRISYTYDAKAGRPVSAAPEFWQQYHDLGWLRRLRVATTSLSAEQRVDGTWAVSVRDTIFSDLAILKGARISVLTLKGTSVVDVRPLAELALRRLRLDETPCKDVTALARIETLESLVLPANPTGVETLRKLPALKRVAFAADAKGEPALDAAAFWTAFDEKGGG